MVGRKKKAKLTQDQGSQEDWLSKLPDALISDILVHLPTKYAVRTSVLSTRWRNLWQCVPGLDLHSSAFSNVDAFASFVDRFFDSHKDSWIRKLRLCSKFKSYRTPSSWIDAVTTRRIQHLDLEFYTYNEDCNEIPQSIYICKTLVQLRLCNTLVSAEFVSLPCLKIMHTGNIFCPATLEKLISGSPVLEDLTIARCFHNDKNQVLQVRSQTLKRIHIVDSAQVVIDAPLLQCLKFGIYSTSKYKIIGSGFPAKLDIGVFCGGINIDGVISHILTDISRVRDLVINIAMWEVICRYSKSRPLGQFHHLSCLNARFRISDLEVLPTLLESCPQLESLILELVSYKNIEPNLTFSTVPRCLASSLKFVEWKRSTKAYKGEMELVRYFLKNSTFLEELRLDVYYPEKAKCGFLTELVAMPRCSSACQVIVSLIPKS